jgi:hypothetical protein
MTEKMQKIVRKCAERYAMTADEAGERIFMSWLAGQQACDRITGGEVGSFPEFTVKGTHAEIFAQIGEIHDERVRRIIRAGIEIRREVEGDSYIVAEYCQKQGLDALAILERIGGSRVLAQAIRDGDTAKIDEAVEAEA